MKNLLIFLLGAAVWLVLWGKLWYDYVTQQITDNASSIIEQLVNNGIGTWGQTIVTQYQWQAQELLDQQKDKMKEELKKQLTDYITQKIDDTIK